MNPLQRQEPPDFERFLRVIRREGDRSYVPFFELCMDPAVLEPLSGLAPPAGLNFNLGSPTYEASFRYFLECCARMGFDHGTINLSGFTGFPVAARHAVEGTARRFLQADDAAIASPQDLSGIAWPSAEAIDVDAMARTATLAPEGLGVMTGGPDVFGTLFEMLGFNTIATLLADQPDLLRETADRIGSILLEVIERTTALDCIRGFVLSGDMGFKTGTMVAPAVLRELVFPWHRRFCRTAHANGKIILFHSCGNLAAVMDGIVASGFDAKHSFEDTLDPHLLNLHAQYGRDICLIGGIDVDFLCRADEAAIRGRVREYIDRMAPDGGYILGSGNSIPDYMPIDNFRTMLDEGLRYGR